MALLDAGILEIDAGLGNLITNTTAGVANALDLTGQQVDATKEKFADLIDPATIEQQSRAMATMIEQMRSSERGLLEGLDKNPVNVDFPEGE